IYNSKALIEILNKDHIAARIYKYISQIRYKTGEKNITNIRTLAAIIPLKVEQETERETKTGIKKYILNRLKPVLTRICKAFDVLVEFGYILHYETEYNKEEDTYYLSYVFNQEKDNICHISSYFKSKNKKEIEQKNKKRNSDIEEAEVIEKSKKTKIKSYEEEFSETILSSLEYLKKNSYIKNLWNQRNDRKISNLLKTEDEAFVVDLLSRLGRSYNENIKASISVYMDGIIKKMRKEEKQMGNNLTLFPINSFSNSSNVAKTKKQIIQSRPILIQESLTWKEVEKKLKKFSIEEQEQIEEKALEKYYQETGGNKSFLLDAKKNNLSRYHKIICSYVEQVLLEWSDK
ncbi:chromosomal replication initiator protein DnaA, partial [Fusobacterium necrophorum DJ-1]